MKKRDSEKFAVYNERKAMRKYSIFRASLEYFIIAESMIAGSLLLTAFFFIYSQKMGVLCWVVFISFFAIMLMIIYTIDLYRELIGLKSSYTEEEFEREFKDEIWLFRIMEKLSRYFIN